MASTFSALKIELIGTGEQSGTWGATNNVNLGTAIEEAIAGRATTDFVSDTDLTITLIDSNETQVARHYILNVVSSATLTTTRNLIVPTIQKPYIIENNTTGGQSIIVKTAAGSGVTVPNGKTVMVYANGTNVTSAITHIPTVSLATDLAIVDGGTGASDVAGARTNLGIGSLASQNADNVAITGGSIAASFTGNLTGNATTVTNGVYTTGDQTIAGNKTFSSPIVGDVTGNVTGNVTGTSANVTGVIASANGGTGVSGLTQNAVITGNGTGAATSIRPSTNGNVLTSKAGATVTAGSFVVGAQYTITSVGTTSFTSIGASANTVGVVFVATGVGTGTGTATINTWASEVPPPGVRRTSGTAPYYGARAYVNFDGTSPFNFECTYVQSGNTVTVTSNTGEHPLLVGNRVFLNFTSGTATDGIYTIETIPSDGVFTVNRTTSASTSGAVTLQGRIANDGKNVNYVSYIGTGNYIVNFETPMVGDQYTPILTGGSAYNIDTNPPKEAGSFVIIGAANSIYVSAVVFF